MFHQIIYSQTLPSQSQWDQEIYYIQGFKIQDHEQ